ncbi:hypothetical protein J1N35_002636 [Gossypium stocksii]|uniref:Uncharacterized protein n=1 Tax=Gossypium stocksii TaxID=47602 RepID=A0A9D3WMF2_9ROSI|nr:hypothetical protein J1N35_002636 [Gossypium stocksii]
MVYVVSTRLLRALLTILDEVKGGADEAHGCSRQREGPWVAIRKRGCLGCFKGQTVIVMKPSDSSERLGCFKEVNFGYGETFGPKGDKSERVSEIILLDTLQRSNQSIEQRISKAN